MKRFFVIISILGISLLLSAPAMANAGVTNAGATSSGATNAASLRETVAGEPEFTIHPSYAHGQNRQWMIETIPAGTTIQDFVTIENLSGRPQILSLLFREADSNNEKFVVQEKSAFKNLGLWTKIPDTKFLLAPSEKKKIPFEITIPKNAEQQSLSGVLYAIQENTGQGLKLVTRIGVRFHVRVASPALAGAANAKSTIAQNHRGAALLLLSLLTIIAWTLIKKPFTKKSRTSMAILLIPLVLSTTTFPFQAARAQEMEVEILAGGYHLKGPGTIVFPKVTASFKDQTTTPVDIRKITKGNNYLEITDENGGNAFQVTISVTDFSYEDAAAAQTYTFSNNNMWIKSVGSETANQDIQTLQGSAADVKLDPAAKNSFIRLGTPQVLLSGTGKKPGQWRIYPLFQITVPGGTHPTHNGESYQSTLTFTIN